MQFGQGFTHDLFGKAGAFAALSGYTECLANVAVTAAAFENRIPDLTVSNTLAETNIHKLEPSLCIASCRRD
ncbi:hypothetical protein PS3A_56940 [Pseudomonas sp. 3A(2025)]